MKTKKSSEKLALRKVTIVQLDRLERIEINMIKGAAGATPATTMVPTCVGKPCPPDVT